MVLGSAEWVGSLLLGGDPQRRMDLGGCLAFAGVGASRGWGLLGGKAVEPLQVGGGDQGGDWLAVAGEDDPFSGVDDAVDELGQFGASLGHGDFDRHQPTLRPVRSVQMSTRAVPDDAEPVPLSRNRDFALLWSGQVLSALGSSTSQLAVPLLVLALTGSAATAGVVSSVALVAGAAARLPGGALADRWSRRRLMLTSDGARLLVSATFAGAVLTGRASVALVLAAVAVIAVFDAMFSPAEIAAVANVVPAGQLPEAFARNQTRNYLVTLAGPPLGGLLYGLGRAVPFVVDTVSYLVSLLTVTAIRSPLQDPPVGRPTQHLLADIREGIAHVLASPFLRAVLVVAALLNLAVDGALFTTTITLRQQGTSAGLVGLAQGLFGAGGLLGAFAAGWLQRRLSFRGLLVTATVVLTVGLALATVLVGHLLMAVPVAVGLFFAPPVNAALFSRLAATTPDRIQARVISVIVLSATVAGALAPLLGGLLIHHSGPVTAMLPWTAATTLAASIALLARGVRGT